MKVIMDIVDKIDDEIEGAKEYAEKYVELKADGLTDWGSKFRNMSEQELAHANVMHDYVVQKIDHLKSVYVVPESMTDIWEKAHIRYVERVAWIRQMLEM